MGSNIRAEKVLAFSERDACREVGYALWQHLEAGEPVPDEQAYEYRLMLLVVGATEEELGAFDALLAATKPSPSSSKMRAAPLVDSRALAGRASK